MSRKLDRLEGIVQNESKERENMTPDFAVIEAESLTIECSLLRGRAAISA
jgi:hypothetical protein